MEEQNDSPKKPKRSVLHITNAWILEALQEEQKFAKDKTTMQTCLRLLIGAIRDERARRERAQAALGAAMMPKQ